MAGMDYGGKVYRNGVHILYESVMGENQIRVSLDRQRNVFVYREKMLILSLTHGDDFDQHIEIEFSGYRLEIRWEFTDNLYQYAQLIEPSGTVWASFSGYGVGEGFDEASYGYSTTWCEKRLKELFPDSFESDLPSNP